MRSNLLSHTIRDIKIRPGEVLTFRSQARSGWQDINGASRKILSVVPGRVGTSNPEVFCTPLARYYFDGEYWFFFDIEVELSVSATTFDVQETDLAFEMFEFYDDGWSPQPPPWWRRLWMWIRRGKHRPVREMLSGKTIVYEEK